VIVSGRNAQRGGEVVEQIRAAGGRADFAAADLRTEDGARTLAATATRLGGGHVDILVNNAGMYPFGPTEATSDADFDVVFGVNVKGPYFLVAALAPAMAARGGGAIVNVSTVGAHLGTPVSSLYGASKAAIELLTKAWAAEYAARGVRVNAVSPGPTRTEGMTAAGEDLLHQLAAKTPAHRYAEAGEIAHTIAFLAGPDASYVHGTILAVDGGRTAV
jgi:NAD(P)-dependent dehydrogenase (short-subunit alcohol dehydrogenase family)